MTNCSLKNHIISIALLLFTFNGYSQIINNMSFEGNTGTGVTPPGWGECHQFSTPDILPGSWNVTGPASDGNTYTGIVTRGNLGPFANNNEDLQTRLLKTIKLGESYDFKIDLSYSRNWGHSISGGTFLRYDTPAKLQIYGGTSPCALTELLWESPAIDNTNWESFSFTLNPTTTDVSYLVLQAANPGATTNFGNLLIDNIAECFIQLNEDIKSDTTICEDEILTLDVSVPDGNYVWQDGTKSPVYSINAAGSYSVNITNKCVSETFQFNVSTRNCVCDTAIPISVMAFDTLICQREPLLIDVSTPGGEYRWEDDNLNPVRTVSEAGKYTVEITNGCDTEFFEFNVTTRNCVCDTAIPIAVSGYDSLVCPGAEILLDASTPGGTFTWDNNDTSAQRLVSDVGTYSVEIYNGCDTELVDFTINEKECFCELSYPNVFSPNDDGMNESFAVTASTEVSNYNLQIFQRTGQLLFESDDPNISWTGELNGKKFPSGVYFWQAQISCQINKEVIEKTYKGSVSLFR